MLHITFRIKRACSNVIILTYYVLIVNLQLERNGLQIAYASNFDSGFLK